MRKNGGTLYEKEIEKKIKELHYDLRKEVLDYVEFLLTKYKGRSSLIKKIEFDWEGSLAEIQG